MAKQKPFVRFVKPTVTKFVVTNRKSVRVAKALARKAK